MLPPYDTLATLADLTALAAATDPLEIWCLGDSFHDVGGCERLPAQACEMLPRSPPSTAGPGSPAITIPVVPALVGGQAVAEVEVDGVILRHEADRPTRARKCPATSTPSCASTAAAAWSRAAASSPARPS
jgi:metallophosphoesterase superfamily enzyme